MNMKTSPHPIEITCSRDFLDWLAEEQISLAFTTYQTNRLFLLGRKPNGDLSTFERLFDRPMGLYARSDRLYVGCRYQVWQLDNTLPPGETHDGYDALYVPRRSFTTGDIDIHDVRQDKDGRLIFVNTLYSCLATLSERYSFAPLWQPPFISKLAPEDRCHLNGLAIDAEGLPRYATAVSRSDVFSGWRKRREAGGILIDIQNDEILLDTLSMPHSPRLHDGKLWLLNAGSGDLGYVDQEKAEFVPVAFCPGFARGLVFHKHYAIVGLSKPRRVKAFEGLSLDDKLAAKDVDALCGLVVIDTRTGNVAHWVEVEGIVSELYDVAVLPGVKQPMALGFKSDEISRYVAIDYPDAAPVFQQLKATPNAHTTPIDFIGMQSAGISTSPSAPNPQPPTAKRPATSPYRFQLSFDMSLSSVLSEYSRLTFPPLNEQVRGRIFFEPLLAAVARLGDEIVGLALAEVSQDRQGASLFSCYVDAPHRRKGIAVQLLASLSHGLKQNGLKYLDLVYSTDWPSASIVEHILKKYHWAPSRTTLYQYKTNSATISAAPWLYDEHANLPSGYTLFEWRNLTPEDRATIQNKQADTGWYPPNLGPFQADDHLAFNGMGLRYQGEVVGWMVTLQSAPDTVQYSSFFVSSEHRRQQVSIPLLAAVINRQIESDLPYYIWQVSADNDVMLAFVRRYLMIYLTKQTERRISRKIL
ncbi:MAG: TIGR03032 family protein [Halieaceae bacterium]|nr:TIGR03032 family protein [Halieaceae bacterium]